MFSRPGKSSLSKHRILGEKEFILQKKFKFKKPERPQYKIHSLPIDEINTLAETETFKIKKVTIIKEAKTKNLIRNHSCNFVFKVQSRNDFYEANVKSK